MTSLPGKKTFLAEVWPWLSKSAVPAIEFCGQSASRPIDQRQKKMSPFDDKPSYDNRRQIIVNCLRNSIKIKDIKSLL